MVSIVIIVMIISAVVVIPVRNAVKVTVGAITVITAATVLKRFVTVVAVVQIVPMFVPNALSNAKTVQVLFAHIVECV